MRFVIQRVKESSVVINDQTVGAIKKGFLVLIGISDEDNEEIADKMIKKMIGLRIFEDNEGKTNLSLNDVDGELLLVSQFTLYADCKKGNRPSFIRAGNRTGRMNCITISLIAAGSRFPSLRQANSVQI